MPAVAVDWALAQGKMRAGNSLKPTIDDRGYEYEASRRVMAAERTRNVSDTLT